MPDLSSLPPQLIAPFAIVFALALFVSKIFDIIEKWKKLRTDKSSSSTTNQNREGEKKGENNNEVAGEMAGQKKGKAEDEEMVEGSEGLSVEAAKIDTVVEEIDVLSKKEIFIYSFLGAITISVLATLIQAIFISSSPFFESQIYNLVSSIFFGFISAVICTFFISKKFSLIRENIVVAILMGLGVTTLLSMPVGVITTIYHVNRAFG